MFPNAFVVIGIGVTYGAAKCKLADVIISDDVQDLGTNVKIENNGLHCGPKLPTKPKLKVLFTRDTIPFNCLYTKETKDPLWPHFTCTLALQ